jgi:hypothetical protein
MVTIVAANLGLGDSITMSGAAVELARQYGQARVPALPHYMENVRSFYVDHPEIEAYEMSGEPTIESLKIVGTALTCGHYGPIVQSFDATIQECVYRQLGVDYTHRWDSCPLQRASESVEQLDWPDQSMDKVFLHEAPDRGYVITRERPKECYAPDKYEGSILRYARMISQAREVHVIDSCFYHLVECINTVGTLYFHFYVKAPHGSGYKPGGVRTFQPMWPSRKEWTVLR